MKKILLFLLMFALITSSLFAIELKPYKASEFTTITVSNPYYMAGDEYTNGFYASYYNGSTLLYNLKNNYKTATFTVGLSDSVNLNNSATVSFYVDGVSVKTLKIIAGDFPEEVEINLNYQRQLKITSTGSSYVVITNIDFK